MGNFRLEGGITVIPEFVALLVALSMYTAAFIGEIVRAGIQAVPQGQTEAARALGLKHGRILRMVIIPQAMRVIIPPLTSQYLNLTKNSSLAVAIAYPDLVAVFAGTILNQTGRAVEIIAITMGVYLLLSLTISGLLNYYNARVETDHAVSRPNPQDRHDRIDPEEGLRKCLKTENRMRLWTTTGGLGMGTAPGRELSSARGFFLERARRPSSARPVGARCALSHGLVPRPVQGIHQYCVNDFFALGDPVACSAVSEFSHFRRGLVWRTRCLRRPSGWSLLALRLRTLRSHDVRLYRAVRVLASDSRFRAFFHGHRLAGL